MSQFHHPPQLPSWNAHQAPKKDVNKLTEVSFSDMRLIKELIKITLYLKEFLLAPNSLTQNKKYIKLISDKNMLGWY